MMVGGALLWLVVASGLLMYTWNTVIAHLFHSKKVSYLQALLFLATVFVLCVPKHMMLNHACGNHMQCHDRSSSEYEGKDESTSPSMEPTP
jgi:hypothetical protein